MPSCRAALDALADPARRRLAERVEALEGGGTAAVAREEVRFDHAFATVEGEAVEWDVRLPGAFVEAVPAALGLPEDWCGYGRLTLDLAAPDAEVRVALVVSGLRCRLRTEHDLAAGEEARLVLDLSDLPLTAGLAPAWRPTAVRIEARWLGGDTTRRLRLKELCLESTEETGGPCVDRFGQRARTAWPGKLAREDEFRADAESEAAALAALAPVPGRDEIGAWTEGPEMTPTGFFRVDTDDEGRWWLVSPQGRPFWSMGTTGVRTTHEGTPVEGREHLFEAVPATDGPFAEAWSDRGLSFYGWNVLRKYGSKEAWRDRVFARFRAWGFNTLGNTCEEAVLGTGRCPYTRRVNTREGDAPRIARRLPDVFDAAWEPHLERVMAESVAPYVSERYLVGYFVDNELPWRSPALAERGPAYVEAYAERYFETVAAALRRQDPNHLYLGCRFVRVLPDDAVVRAARRADIVSVNCYALYPDRGRFDRWHGLTGRPILIGEHHLSLRSPRQLEPLYDAFGAAERARYYRKFLRELARMPYAVGSHWFQWVDQPLTGRVRDGENQTIGFVDIVDRPHAEMVEAARAAAARIYDRHAASEPM